ncbi:MAG: C10 family peptidase [Bacteroides sp.]|nr:C10 family peptidase [Bacteroides sp.]
MRRVAILFIFIFLFSPFIEAKEITADVATTVATQVLKNHSSAFSGKVKSVEGIYLLGVKCYYIVNFYPQGWALISADDRVSPILGYSSVGSYRRVNQPENIEGWLESYVKQIYRVVQAEGGTRHRGWDLPSISTRTSGVTIAPLIEVNWNQSTPYNKYCPSDEKGRALVGCVAVAMAQAMSVSRYPSKPVGTYSYVSPNYGTLYINYDNESAYNWSNIISGANSKDEVAHLLYHCGVALQMDYGVDASGTQSSYIATALKRNFSYSSSVVYYARSSYTGDWKQLIINELQSGRPVCYSGQDIKKGYGHCFNLDGYDGNNMFHVNWGWGGANNGYFTVDGLKDATMDMDYTASQGVVVGIRPPSDAPSNIILSSSKVMEKQPAGTVVGAVTVESEASNPQYEFSVRGPYSPVVHGYLKAPFEIINGELCTTESLNVADGNQDVEITVKNVGNNLSLTQSFTINVVSSNTISLASAIALLYDKQTKEIVLTSKENVAYIIYSGNNSNIVASGNMQSNVPLKLSTDSWEAENLIQFNNAGDSKQIRIKLAK